MKGVFNGFLMHLALLFPLKHQLGKDMLIEKRQFRIFETTNRSRWWFQPTGKKNHICQIGSIVP